MSEQLASVTKKLTDSLVQVRQLILDIDGRTARLNDKDQFHNVVRALDELAVSILEAAAPASFLGRTPTGARFDAASGTPVAVDLSSAAEYLRGSATEVIGAGGLNQYETSNVTAAYAILKDLYNSLVSSMREQVERDLYELATSGPVALVLAAEALQFDQVMSEDTPEPGEPDWT